MSGGKIRFILIAWFGLGLTACVSKPTQVNENEARLIETADSPDITIPPLDINESTVIIDVRPAFEYTTAHFPRAINMQWDEFSEPEQKGVLQKDLFSAARRLARLGIEPDSKVVVVGLGKEGNGEEGRVAWMLRYMGVRAAVAAPLDYFKGPMTNNVNTTPAKNAPIWKPQLDESFLINKEELLHVLNKSGVYKSTSFGEGPVYMYRIIDVRSPRAYLGKEGLGVTQNVPNMDAINIHWKEFFDAGGRVDPAMRSKLLDVDIRPAHRIIVISDDGVSSGAVTVALRDLGFPLAANFAGGLRELLASP